MASLENRLTLATWLLIEPGRLVRDGALLCRGDTVVYAGRRADVVSGKVEAVDLGEALILPGLVNAHTHLELTDMTGAVGGGDGFVPWLKGMLSKWDEWSPEWQIASVRRGAALCLESGTTCVGNIGSRPAADDALSGGDATRPAGPRQRLFHEVIGLDPLVAEERLGEALLRGRAIQEDESLRVSLSPHALYSVSETLLRACFDRAAEKGGPIAVHAAETREEEAFALRGEGPLREFLENRGVLPDAWRPPAKRPLEYLADCGLGRSPALVAHANYANDDEIRWMAENGVSVAFCPPCHRFFGHDPYPLRAMLEAGVNLCVATDSLASADSLDVLKALRMARDLAPDVAAEDWIAMVTTNPARALGWSDRLGALRSGMFADFLAYETPSACSAPLDALLSEPLPLAGVWLGGRPVNRA